LAHLDLPGLLLLAGAALLAGAVNAIAGGGTLISFPALLLLGLQPVAANVSNTLGLLPGYASGSVAYRAELSVQAQRVRVLGGVSVLGAVTGAFLVTRTSPTTFSAIVPWLILFASALLLAQPLVASRLASGRPEGQDHRAPLLVGGQFLGAVYGAFFGAGLGVMTLAILGLFIRDHLQRLNALKGLLALIINVVAAAYFAAFGPVAWNAVAVMLPASVAGGFAGVALARRLSPRIMRGLIVAFGVAVALRMLL
jgi:uncharacterized protein